MKLRPRTCMYGMAAVLATVIALLVCGCSCSRPSPSPMPDDNSTDQLFTDSVHDAQLDVVMFEGRAILVPSGEPLDLYVSDQLEDAHFYRVVADVDYLSGGVAGYVRYPDIKSVSSVTEESPDAVDIPSITEQSWGFVSVRGYADADFLLREYGNMAVLADGQWTYRYDKSFSRDDGSAVCHRDGVSREDIEARIAEGVVCNEDFFLVPAVS